MTYQEAKAHADNLRNISKAAGDRLSSFPKGAMGLVLDSVKSSAEYIEAKRDFDIAFANERNFNAYFVKTFKAERRAERLEKLFAK